MAQIRNMGTATMKFNEGIIVKGQAGDDIHALIVTGSIIATSFTGSATQAVNDQMGTTIIGGVFEIDQGIFQSPQTNPVYFPADDSFIERAGPVGINYFIAPFNGEIIKIQVRVVDADYAGNFLTASFHVGSSGDSAYNSTPNTSIVTAGLNRHNVHTFDFMGVSGSTLSEGDIFGFSLRHSSGFTGTESIQFTTVMRYNPYS
jgi:hypothetical protein